VVGHRDLSPDLDGDGQVEPHEWIKLCPAFEVRDWLANFMQPTEDQVFHV
jgi:N-acetyl-anhydromuramyl-L-alanine amidase AmpD